MIMVKGGTFSLYSLLCRHARVSTLPKCQIESWDVDNRELFGFGCIGGNVTDFLSICHVKRAAPMLNHNVLSRVGVYYSLVPVSLLGLSLWVFGGFTMNLIWTDQNCMGVKSSVSRFIVMSTGLERRIAKASRALTQEVGRRKRGQLVKGNGGNLGSVISSPQPAYEKFLCLCIGSSDVMKFRLHQENSDVMKYLRKWCMLHLSSDMDKCKEEEKRNGEQVVRIPTPEHRGSYLAFHHDERHRGQGENPLVLPLIKKLKNHGQVGCDTSFAVVGSSIYLCGGGRNKSWSRKVTYFDASRPEDGWNRGPRTICERTDAAIFRRLRVRLLLNGAHCLTAPVLLDLRVCLLLPVALDDGNYSGHIFVGSKSKGAICLHDVTHDVWKTLGVNIHFGVCSNPIVVGTTIYWIKLNEQQIGACDIVRRSEFSMPLGDFQVFGASRSVRMVSGDNLSKFGAFSCFDHAIQLLGSVPAQPYMWDRNADDGGGDV
ncbi:hypothetical protein RHSIM_Rhsim05G0135400 [Rhododendron simsii]|uniref:Uncharacterized protein n=1 Tax=Rhododendron simsii TaxID=118357 RepID=A0A834H1B9_RHOSS|nr:hypothetical protein RHSIM_Rhsim05G0135400 [Rhododendron simsii]